MLSFQVWIPYSISPSSYDNWSHGLNVMIHLYKPSNYLKQLVVEKEWWNLCPFRSTLYLSLPSYVVLEADLYGLHHWAPLSSGFQLGLKNAQHQRAGKTGDWGIDSLSSVSTESLQVVCIPLLKTTATFRQPRPYKWVPMATPPPCSSTPRNGNSFSIILLPG